MSKCYSTDESDFNYDYEDLLHHISEEYEEGDLVTYWEGNSVSCSHDDFICVGDLIDGSLCRAYDFAAEYSEMYLDDLSEDRAKELQELIVRWMNKNIEQPRCFGVEGIKKVVGVWDGEDITIYSIDGVLEY